VVEGIEVGLPRRGTAGVRGQESSPAYTAAEMEDRKIAADSLTILSIFPCSYCLYATDSLLFVLFRFDDRLVLRPYDLVFLPDRSVGSRARVRRSGLRRAACALGDGLVCPSVDTPDRPPATATSLALGGRQRRPWQTPLKVILCSGAITEPLAVWVRRWRRSKVTPRTPLAHARGSIRDDLHFLWWARAAMADSRRVSLHAGTRR
jgi:hypothetical protein